MHTLTQQFTDWVRKQPRDATYNFDDHNACAIAQFLDAKGITHTGVGGYGVWYDRNNNPHDMGVDAKGGMLSGTVFAPYGTTYGALADRLTGAGL